MLRLLVAVDGSQPSSRAVRHALKLAAKWPDAKLHLLNVQMLLPAAVSDFLREQDVRSYHQDEGNAALKEAEAILNSAGIPYERHIAVGPVAETIVDYAAKRNCDEIVMGTRGLTPISGLLLGSVAMKVLHLAGMPVTLIK